MKSLLSEMQTNDMDPLTYNRSQPSNDNVSVGLIIV